MSIKQIIGVPAGQGGLAVNDDDTSPADVSTAIAAHAALTTGVHGLGTGGTPLNLDIYIDGVTGSDANAGTSKVAPLATIPGYYTRYGDQLPYGSTVRVHLAGTGGADPWVTPLTPQLYDCDVFTFGVGTSFGNSLVFRGPTDMVPATLATGLPTAVMDNPPARVCDANFPPGADPAGLRTEILCTGAAPGWTIHDLGPRGKQAFLRVTRAGVKRIFEIPIADNTASSVIVDTLGIVGNILNTDTLEIVVCGSQVRGATLFLGAWRTIIILGYGAYPIFATAADMGYNFERIGLFSPQVAGTMMTFDRCMFASTGPESLSVSNGGVVSVVNCSSHDAGPFFTRGGSHVPVNSGQSRPDSGSNPATVVAVVGMMAKNVEVTNNGIVNIALPWSCYGGTQHGIACNGGGRFNQNTACVLLGGDSAAQSGITCLEAGMARIRGGANTTITGTGGALSCDGVNVAYGTAGGQFQEVGAGAYNGNLHNTTIVGGSPTGGMSRIYV